MFNIFDFFAFLTFDFGARNQARKTQGTHGRLKEPRGNPVPQGTRGSRRPAQLTGCFSIQLEPLRLSICIALLCKALWDASARARQ
jgi:hypothetical protein